MKTNSVNSLRIKKMTLIALFCALSYVVSLMFPLKVSFLTLDFKDCITAICGMLFGPVAGLFTAIIVPFIELITTSTTGLYGLIMNILSSVAFVGVSSLIYKYNKTIYGAVIGLLSAIPTTVGVMLLANLLITPGYMKVDINTVIKLIPPLLLPFNLVKSILNAGFVMLFYKPISNALKKSGLVIRSEKPSVSTIEFSKKRTIAVTLISVVITAVAFAILFIFFDVTFDK